MNYLLPNLLLVLFLYFVWKLVTRTDQRCKVCRGHGVLRHPRGGYIRCQCRGGRYE